MEAGHDACLSLNNDSSIHRYTQRLAESRRLPRITYDNAINSDRFVSTY